MTQEQLVDEGKRLAGGNKVFSTPTLDKLEHARSDSYRGATLTWVAKALRWPDDAIDRLLDGADPADFEEQDESTNWEAELVQTIRGLTEVVRELRAEVRMARDLPAPDRAEPPA